MTRIAAKALPALLMVILAACGGASISPSASEPEPSSAQASASQAPSPSPSPTAEPVALPPTILATTAVGRLIIDELPVYDSQDGTTPVGELVRGELIQVTGNAYESGGFAWYPVQFDFGTGEGIIPVGVVQAGEAGVDYFEAVPVTCPPGAATFEAVRDLDRWSRWVCFGNDDLTLTAVVDVPCCNPPDGYVREPSWLAHDIRALLGSLNQGPNVIPLHIDPASGLTMPERGQVVTLTGHFGDPAALTCTAVPEDPSTAPPLVAQAVILACQMEFVVTSYEVIGTQSMPPCC